MQLDLFNVEDSFKDADAPHKNCIRCGTSLPDTTDFYRAKRYTINEAGDIKQWRSNSCKKCDHSAHADVRQLKKYHIKPDTDVCECCGKSGHKLKLDHDHYTKQFRGWICDNCNTGIGRLSDSIEGVEKALAYLKRAYE